MVTEQELWDELRRYDMTGDDTNLSAMIYDLAKYVHGVASYRFEDDGSALVAAVLQAMKSVDRTVLKAMGEGKKFNARNLLVTVIGCSLRQSWRMKKPA